MELQRRFLPSVELPQKFYFFYADVLADSVYYKGNVLSLFDDHPFDAVSDFCAPIAWTTYTDDMVQIKAVVSFVSPISHQLEHYLLSFDIFSSSYFLDYKNAFMRGSPCAKRYLWSPLLSSCFSRP